MDRKYILFALFALAFLSFAGAFYTKNFSDRPATPKDQLITDEEANTYQDSTDTGNSISNHAGNTPSEPQPHPEKQILQNYLAARSATEAFHQIELAQKLGFYDLSLYLETQLTGNCYRMESWTEPLHERTRWAWEAMLGYCSNYDLSMSQRQHDYNVTHNKSITGTYEEDLKQQLDNLDFDRKIEDLSHYMANAKYPYELHGARYYLISLMREFPLKIANLGQDHDVPINDVFDIQLSAIMLTDCRIFGGCGPNDIQLLSVCFQSGNCDRGWNMEDYWLNNLSPMEYEQVNKVSNYLLSLRVNQK